MKISTRARYSIRLMIYLADHSNNKKPIGLKEISANQGLSMRYLEQLVVPLKNASLIRSVAGKHGGYYLSGNPKEIRIGDIVEAAIGPIRLMECLDKDYECSFVDVCVSRRMWGLINTRITDVLYDYSLDDLSETRMRELIVEKDQGTDDKSLPC